jgi:AraC-like DNA-binding protein
MTLLFEERLSGSPYVETVTRGRTVRAGSTIRPAEIHWHMIFTKHSASIHPLVVGPLTTSGVASWGAGGEILWIKFKVGTFMPHLPTRDYLDIEQALPDASSQRFWLKGSTWQFPDYENVETFIDRLVRDEILVFDSVVDSALRDHMPALSPRTVRYRFLRATGLTQNHIRQFQRARKAEALLKEGSSILDVVYQLGYFDQPHLTRSLKQFIGYTPAQIIHMWSSDCQKIQDTIPLADYHTNVLTNTR